MGTFKFDGNISIEEAIKRHKGTKNTAIPRKAPSRPMRLLYERDLLIGRMLDYGCGRGTDAKFFGMEAYDPFWQKEKPSGLFDTITCHFVLNVVDTEVRQFIINDITGLLKQGGNAYFTVRRDMKESYNVQNRGYSQSLVVLSLLSIEKNTSYEIYKMEK